MSIPDCYGGHLNKGGDSPISGQNLDDLLCPEPGLCYCSDGKLCEYKSCNQSELMRKYEKDDIIMADEDNTCSPRLRAHFTHDTVIVGIGRSTIYEFWLVK